MFAKYVFLLSSLRSIASRLICSRHCHHVSGHMTEGNLKSWLRTCFRVKPRRCSVRAIVCVETSTPHCSASSFWSSLSRDSGVRSVHPSRNWLLCQFIINTYAADNYRCVQPIESARSSRLQGLTHNGPSRECQAPDSAYSARGN